MRLAALGCVLLALGSGCRPTTPPTASVPPPTVSSNQRSSEPATPPLATAGDETTVTSAGPVAARTTADSSDALVLAFRWFDALRRSDVASLAAVMDVPSVIQGFVLEAGPRADACGARPETNVIGVGIERQATTPAELNDALGCLVLDPLLVGSIPDSSGRTWPQDRRDSHDRNDGSLGLIVADGLADPLRPFLPRLAALGRTHFLAQAVMTDNNGVTNHVALAITIHRPPRVAAVYIHEEFRE